MQEKVGKIIKNLGKVDKVRKVEKVGKVRKDRKVKKKNSRKSRKKEEKKVGKNIRFSPKIYIHTRIMILTKLKVKSMVWPSYQVQPCSCLSKSRFFFIYTRSVKHFTMLFSIYKNIQSCMCYKTCVSLCSRYFSHLFCYFSLQQYMGMLYKACPFFVSLRIWLESCWDIIFN